MINGVQHKYVEIAEDIKKKILKGEYPEGERIPSIRKLAEQFDVNPQTVNKATSVLSSQGFLISRQGAGSVAAIPSDKPEPLRNSGIVMLMDKARSNLVTDPLENAGYHCKDIYLSFLVQRGNDNKSANFMVYDRNKNTVPEEFIRTAGRSAGFIVQGGLPDCYFEYFQKHRTPFVLINRIPPPWFQGIYGSVMISLDKLKDLVNYLVSLGHNRILYLFSSELEINPTLERRLEILRAAAEEWESGVIIEEFDYNPNSDETVNLFNRYLSEGFTAGIGYNDVSALGFYRVPEKAGIKIPEDFSIVGFDDIFSSQIASPPLTTVRVDRNELVTRGLSILGQIIRGSVKESVIDVVETSLVFRRSSAVAPKG